MKFFDKREYLEAGELAVVTCSHQCNVRLMDDVNFSRYQRGESFYSYGGGYRRFPVHIAAPTSGFWTCVLDLGGYVASIRYSIKFLRRQ
jgi:hypothetical protein